MATKPKKKGIAAEGLVLIVKEKRAQAIATAVLDQKRTFPNAITLATDVKSFRKKDGLLPKTPNWVNAISSALFGWVGFA